MTSSYLRTRAALMALVLVCLPRAVQAFQVDTEPEFDPDGFYMIEGEPPAGFRDIQHFALTTLRGPGEPPLTGGLFTVDRDYPFAKVTVKDKRLTFVTKAVRGIRYTFEGTFTRSGAFSQSQPDGVILTGCLSRQLRGKVVGAADLSFTYFVGD